MNLRRITALLLFVTCIFTFSCSESVKMSVDDGDYGTERVYSVIHIADYGDVYIELYPEIAPITVDNFISNVSSGIYTNTVIHWIAPGFGIQGGDPTGTGLGLEGQKRIKGEFAENGVDNKISHIRGTLTMARKNGDNDSATSQFIILISDQTQLDGRYAAFARVVRGMDVVDAVAAIETFEENGYRPETDVVVTGAQIIDSLPE